MIKKSKKQEGITLIALIVTIIILLILAGITIGMLTSNRGVLNQGTEAKKSTVIGQEKQYVQLAYNSAAISTLGEKVIPKNVQDELDNLVGKYKTMVTGTDDVIKIKFIDTNHFYKIKLENEEVSEASGKTTNNLQIGDFVNYTYDTEESINIKAYSGTTIEPDVVSDTGAQTITQTGNLKWRIFNIDEKNETIDLISENPTSSKLIIKSTPGYTNGVQVLNNICRQQYSNARLHIYARSININDIYNKLNTSGKNYLRSVENTIITATDGRWYPTFYQYENGSGIDSETVKTNGIDVSDAFTDYSEVTKWWTKADSKLTCKITCWKPAANREYYDNEMEYNLIYNCTNFYWLASRSVALDETASETVFAFTITSVGNHDLLNGGHLATNYNHWQPLDNRYLRPIVTVGFDLLNDECEKDENDAWNLKQ